MKEDEIVNASEPTVDGDATEVFSKLLAVLREQDARINRQDELLLAMQREISLLAKAISGHQQIIEASQPETKPAPPKPPTIVH